MPPRPSTPRISYPGRAFRCAGGTAGWGVPFARVSAVRFSVVGGGTAGAKVWAVISTTAVCDRPPLLSGSVASSDQLAGGMAAAKVCALISTAPVGGTLADDNGVDFSAPL